MSLRLCPTLFPILIAEGEIRMEEFFSFCKGRTSKPLLKRLDLVK
jgi:hypothetical protein